MSMLLALGLASAAPDQTHATVPKAEKRVCRHEDVIGSVIPARICLTRTEWEQLGDYYARRDQSFIDRRSERRGVLKSAQSPE